MFEENIVKKFWSSVSKNGDNECWEWIKGKSSTGYGVFCPTVSKKTKGIRTKIVSTHRYSYELHYRLIPKGLFVCHHCDNPPCVNPKHLFLGTNSDNINDMYSKGRGAWLSDPKHKLRLKNNWLGENNPQYKPKIKLRCSLCNIIFFIQPFKSKTRRFCSLKCYNSVRGYVSRGKNIPHFFK